MPDATQRYPAWRFHATLPAKIVETADEDAQLGAGWADNPSKLHPNNATPLVEAVHVELPIAEPPGLEVPIEEPPDPDLEPDEPEPDEPEPAPLPAPAPRRRRARGK